MEDYSNSDSYNSDSDSGSETDTEYPEEYSNNLKAEKNENIEYLQSLSNQKYELLNTYNNGKLDIDIFLKRLRPVENNINTLLKENLEISQVFLDNEINFLTMLNEYKSRLLKKESVESDYVKNINSFLEKIRKNYADSLEEITPLESLSNEDTLEVRLDKLLEMEENSLLALAKKMKIHIPKKSEFRNVNEFNQSMDKFYTRMLREVPSNKGISRLKSEYKRYDIKPSKNITELFNDLSISKKVIQPEKKISKYILSLINSKSRIKKKRENNSEYFLIGHKFTDVWRLPVLESNGKYSFTTFDNFEKYLMSLKDVISRNNNKLESELSSKLQIADRIIIHKNINNNNTKLYEINQYLSNETIPESFVNKNSDFLLVIHNLKRRNIIKRFYKIIKNESIVNVLEHELFKSSKNIEDYSLKVENVLFVLEYYPEILSSLLSGTISASYLISFQRTIIKPNETVQDILLWKAPLPNEQKQFSAEVDKVLKKLLDYNNTNSASQRFTFDEYKEFLLKQLIVFKGSLYSQRTILKANVTLRKNVVTKFKNYFFKNIKLRINSVIIRDIISTSSSKNLELLIYDNSDNDKEYIKVSNSIGNLLNNVTSFSNDILSNKISNNQLILLINKSKFSFDLQLKNIINYSDLSIKALDSLLSQERNQLKILHTEYNTLLGVFSEEGNPLDWVPTAVLFNPSEINKFNTIKKNTLKKLNVILDSLNSQRRQKNLPLLSEANYNIPDFKDALRNITRYKRYLLSKQKNYYNEKIRNISAVIKKINEKILLITSTRKKKINTLLSIQKKIITRLRQSKINNKITIINNYSFIDSHLVNEVILAYKRAIFNNNFKKIVTDLDYIDSLYSNSFIDNEVYYSLYRQNFNESSNPEFKNMNNYYYKKSLELICNEVLFINLEDLKVSNNKELLNLLTEQWPKIYIPTKDNTLNEILNKLMTYKDFSYYYPKSNQIIIQNQISDIINKVVPRKESIIYNPSTDKYNTNDGYLFEIYKFTVGLNGQPLMESTTVEDIVARTGNKIYKVVNYPKEGKVPFIKLKQFNKDYPEQVIDVWKMVPNKFVKNYPLNYDTCSRNDNNESGCNNSVGLGGVKCEYSRDNKKCKTTFK